MVGATTLRSELVAQVRDAMVRTGLDEQALAAALGWPPSRVAKLGDPAELGGFDFADLLDLLEAVGLDAGETTRWLADRYRANRARAKEGTGE